MADDDRWAVVPPPRRARQPAAQPRVGSINVRRLFARFTHLQRTESTGDFVSVYVLPGDPEPGDTTFASVADAMEALREGDREGEEAIESATFTIAGQPDPARMGIARGVRVPLPANVDGAVVCCAVPGSGVQRGRHDAIFYNLRAADSRRPDLLFDEPLAARLRSPLPRFRPPPPHITVLCSKREAALPNTLMTHLTFAHRDADTWYICVDQEGHDTVFDVAEVGALTMQVVRERAARGDLGRDPGLPARALAASAHLRRTEEASRRGGGNFATRRAMEGGGLVDAALEAYLSAAPPHVRARLFAPEDDGPELLVLDGTDPSFPHAVYVTPEARFIGDSYLLEGPRTPGAGFSLARFGERLKEAFGFLDGALDLTVEEPRDGDQLPRLVKASGGGGGGDPRARRYGLRAASLLLLAATLGLASVGGGMLPPHTPCRGA